jgi:phosphatidylglycerophosphatase A
MSNFLKKLLITGLGTGYLRPAPGTWGSLGPCIIFFLMARMDARSGRVTTSAGMLAIVILASVTCVALGGFAEKAFGRKDPHQATADEWAGQALTLFLLPTGNVFCEAGFDGHYAGPCVVVYGWHTTLLTAAMGFVAFRLADIIKPPPARQLEKLPAGWGILLDDLMAGVYANIVCQLVLRLGLGLH